MATCGYYYEKVATTGGGDGVLVDLWRCERPVTESVVIIDAEGEIPMSVCSLHAGALMDECTNATRPMFLDGGDAA
jgi:hypothetical protein